MCSALSASASGCNNLKKKNDILNISEGTKMACLTKGAICRSKTR
jgi:hypothetical protein